MNSKDWFVDWFDTEYYHQLYKTRDEDEAKHFIKTLLVYLQLEPSSRVLDLACGKGRHSRTLASHDLNVLGVDLSANSIRYAKQFEQANLRFAVQDMRNPLDLKFDAIFNLFTSFGYFDSMDDNEKVIKAVQSMLKPNGFFVIDFMNAKKVVANLIASERKEIDGVKYLIKREFSGTHIYKRIEIQDEEKSFVFTERVQYLIEKDFRTLLEANDFKVVDVFGNFNLDPFNEECSDRLILIAKKTK